MDLIVQGISRAIELLIHGDPEVVQITLLSLAVSLAATAISLFIGISLGTIIALTRFWGRRRLY